MILVMVTIALYCNPFFIFSTKRKNNIVYEKISGENEENGKTRGLFSLFHLLQY